MAITVAGIILTKNEAENIIDCIKSLDFCDEIIIIDDNSEDKTVSEIRKLKNSKITLYEHSLNNDFASARNFALSNVNAAWALFVDADERISKKLQDEIKIAILNENTFNGYFLKRQDFIWGKGLKHGETSRVKLIRLAKKTAGTWQGKVHEIWNVTGRVGELNNPLLHYPHQTSQEFLAEINRYTTIRAKELHEKGVQTNIFMILFYTKAKFIQNYILRFGFLDGIQGFLVAMFMSFHSFLVRSKLYLLNHKK